MSYFWSDVRGLVFGSLAAIRTRDFSNWNFRFATWILLATVPILVAGVVLAPWLNACDSPLRTLTVIGIACLVMGALLGLAEVYSMHLRTLDNVTLVDALVIGVAQVGALIPGVSRSGSTLTAALFRDLERDEAARFSFLLGLPAIAAAGFKNVGIAQGASRCARLVDPRLRARHCVDLGLHRDLEPDADTRNASPPGLSWSIGVSSARLFC